MAIKFAGGSKSEAKPKAKPAASAPVKKRKKRSPYLSGKTVEATKPWLAEGISRRTWYARRKKAERAK